MKLNRDRLDKLELAFGLLVGVIITAVLVYQFGAIFIGVLVAAGLLAILFDRFIHFSSVKLDDERLEKISMFASMTALLTTVVLIAGLKLLMVIRLVPEIDSSTLLTMMLYLIFAIFMGSLIFYYWKGDVE